MAADTDIHRIVIETSGDEVTQREASQDDLAQASDAAAAKRDFENRMQEIAEQMSRGEHPEPILPSPVADSPSDNTDDSLDKLTDSIDSLNDTLTDSGQPDEAAPPPSIAPFGTVPYPGFMGPNDAGGSGGEPPAPPTPPSLIPFGTAPYPSFAGPTPPPPPPPSAPPLPTPFSNAQYPPWMSPTGPTPPPPPLPPPPAPPPSPPQPPAPPPIPPGAPPTNAPPNVPPIPPGPPPIPPPPGGGLGGMAFLDELLGPIGLILLGIDAAVETLEELYNVATMIDDHIMSLAADIRPYSGSVQMADAYSFFRNLQAMIERSQALGEDIAVYERSRADLNYQIARIVTALEKNLIPAAVVVVDAMNAVISVLSAPVLRQMLETGLFGPIGAAAIEAVLTAARLYIEAQKAQQAAWMNSLQDEINDLMIGNELEPIPNVNNRRGRRAFRAPRGPFN